MASRLILKQQIGAGAAADLYTVPTGKQFVGNLTVCNRDSGAGTYTIALRLNGETLATRHYLYFGNAIAANTTFERTGLVMMEGTVLTHNVASTVTVTLGGEESDL